MRQRVGCMSGPRTSGCGAWSSGRGSSARCAARRRCSQSVGERCRGICDCSRCGWRRRGRERCFGRRGAMPAGLSGVLRRCLLCFGAGYSRGRRACIARALRRAGCWGSVLTSSSGLDCWLLKPAETACHQRIMLVSWSDNLQKLQRWALDNGEGTADITSSGHQRKFY